MRDPEIAKAAALAAKGFQSAGKINAYGCKGASIVYPDGQPGGCRKPTITIDRETGVTPYIIKCVHCGGEATSGMYQVPQSLIPTHEWYRPDTFDDLPDHTRRHVLSGGLLFRQIEQPPKTVEINKNTIVENEIYHPPLGPVVMEMPEGGVPCYDAESCTMITGQRQVTGEKFIVIISVADIGDRSVGTLAQFSPAEARSFAASLIGAADDCDGGQKGAH